MHDGSPSPPNDTHPKIHALLIEGYRKMSPSQKLECVWGMLRTARQLALLDVPEGKVSVRFASPEDTLLHKLVWYRLGNEISDRQWGDVLGLLEVQGDALDHEYLDRWAPALDVADLLARARREQRKTP